MKLLRLLTFAFSFFLVFLFFFLQSAQTLYLHKTENSLDPLKWFILIKFNGVLLIHQTP